MGKWTLDHVQGGTTEIFFLRLDKLCILKRLSSHEQPIPFHQNVFNSMNVLLKVFYFPHMNQWMCNLLSPDSGSGLCGVVSCVPSTEMKLPCSWVCESSTEHQPCTFTLYFAAVANRKRAECIFNSKPHKTL